MKNSMNSSGALSDTVLGGEEMAQKIGRGSTLLSTASLGVRIDLMALTSTKTLQKKKSPEYEDRNKTTQNEVHGEKRTEKEWRLLMI